MAETEQPRRRRRTAKWMQEFFTAKRVRSCAQELGAMRPDLQQQLGLSPEGAGLYMLTEQIVHERAPLLLGAIREHPEIVARELARALRRGLPKVRLGNLPDVA